MPLNSGLGAMASWPLDWRLGVVELGRVTNRLGAMGFRVWDNGRFLIPSPFNEGSLNCRVEAWKPGLAFCFADQFPLVILSWQEWRKLSSRLFLANAQGFAELIHKLIEKSHPLRFSPYFSQGAGEGLFVGREAELSLLLSPLPRLVVEGPEGMGKTSLFIRAGRQAEVPVLCCQAFSARDLAYCLAQLSKNGRMPNLLLLDEMDGLLLDPRALQVLTSLNRRGIAWRAAVHRVLAGIGPNLKLPVPKGLDLLLNPLAEISGKPLAPEVKQCILQTAGGNPRSLQCLCQQILHEMGQRPQEVSPALLSHATEQASIKQGWLNLKVG